MNDDAPEPWLSERRIQSMADELADARAELDALRAARPKREEVERLANEVGQAYLMSATPGFVGGFDEYTWKARKALLDYVFGEAKDAPKRE